MATDYLDSSKVGQLAGSLLSQRKKTSSRERNQAFGATVLLETINALKNKEKVNVSNSVNDLKLEYDNIIKDYEYKYEQNQGLRQDINKFNSIDRENFLNKKVMENYNTSNLRRTLGKSYEDLEAHPVLRKQLFDWQEEEKKELIDYYTQVQEDPFVTKSFSSLSKPVLDELQAKLYELKNDPTNTSLFLKGINKIFPNMFGTASKQAQLASAVTETERKRTEQEKFSNSVNTKLQDYYSGSQDMIFQDNAGYIVSYDNVSKDLEKTKKDLYPKLSEIGNKMYTLKSIDGKTRQDDRRPFRKVNEIEILKYDANKNQYILDKNANPQDVAATMISKLALMYKAEDAALINDRIKSPEDAYSMSDLYNLAIDDLVNTGHLGKRTGRTGKIYLKRPVSYRGFQNRMIPEELFNVVNTLETDEDIYNRSQKTIDYNNMINTELDNQVIRLTQQRETIEDIEQKENINNQLDILTSAKAGDNIKLRDEILLQKIENPSEDDMGKAIQIGSNVLILGQVDEDTKNIFRNKFIENYGSSVNVPTVSQEEEEGEGEIDTFVLPTQEQIDELTKQPKALVRQAITRYNEINEKLKDTENLSPVQIDALNIQKKRIEDTINDNLERIPFDFRGTPNVLERQKLRGIERLLEKPEKLSNTRIRELEKEKEELENIINS
jgi:hypothetical protein